MPLTYDIGHFQSLRRVVTIIRRSLVAAFPPQMEAAPAAQLLIGSLETALNRRVGAPEELARGHCHEVARRMRGAACRIVSSRHRRIATLAQSRASKQLQLDGCGAQIDFGRRNATKCKRGPVCKKSCVCTRETTTTVLKTFTQFSLK